MFSCNSAMFCFRFTLKPHNRICITAQNWLYIAVPFMPQLGTVLGSRFSFHICTYNTYSYMDLCIACRLLCTGFLMAELLFWGFVVGFNDFVFLVYVCFSVFVPRWIFCNLKQNDRVRFDIVVNLFSFLNWFLLWCRVKEDCCCVTIMSVKFVLKVIKLCVCDLCAYVFGIIWMIVKHVPCFFYQKFSLPCDLVLTSI